MSELKKFIFKGLPVRGALVRLTGAWQEILSRQRQSASTQEVHQGLFLPAVSELMGEMAAASVLLHTTIKFDGTLILQIQGEGPVKLAVAEAQSDMGIRATAKVDGDIPKLGGIDALCNANGKGRCAITLDPKNPQPGQQPYQGVVPLSNNKGESYIYLCDVLEGYMEQSEQLPTRIILAADEKTAAGLIVQRMPGEGEKNIGTDQVETGDEAFNRIATFAKSLKREELLTLSTHDILHRLFWQEGVELFDDVEQPYFRCSCSQERVSNMLKGLGKSEVDEIIAEQGQAEVVCDFCGAVYRFDPVDVQTLFVDEKNQLPPSNLLQ